MQELEKINLQKGTSPCKPGLMTQFRGMYNLPLATQADPTIYLARPLSLGDLNTNSSDKCYSKVVFFYFSQHLEELSRITKHKDILLNQRMELLLILQVKKNADTAKPHS